MEYGEAVSADALERAVAVARDLLGKGAHSVESAASQAVSRAYCACVTDGEDAAEGRFSEVHKSLIASVAERLRTDLPPVQVDPSISVERG